jgi:hypothetical protein
MLYRQHAADTGGGDNALERGQATQARKVVICEQQIRVHKAPRHGPAAPSQRAHRVAPQRRSAREVEGGEGIPRCAVQTRSKCVPPEARRRQVEVVSLHGINANIKEPSRGRWRRHGGRRPSRACRGLPYDGQCLSCCSDGRDDVPVERRDVSRPAWRRCWPRCRLRDAQNAATELLHSLENGRRRLGGAKTGRHS